MGSLRYLFLDGVAIKGLPCSISHLTQLDYLCLKNCRNLRSLPNTIGHLTRLSTLNLEECRNLRSLPNTICGLKSLKTLGLDSCSSVEAFPEIMEDMEHLEELNLCGTDISELPSSIEHLRGLWHLQLNKCEKLVSLPNSIGNLTCLVRLCVSNCSKLRKFPNNLRSLHCCLRDLDLGGCNLMEGEIPSDLWCLSSLKFLNLSGNHIRCVPVGIIQLSRLFTLFVNHCPMLEEIAELPSSLGWIRAHGCPCLETETFSSLLWSSLLKCFKSPIQLAVSWHNYFFFFLFSFLKKHEIYMTNFCAAEISSGLEICRSRKEWNTRVGTPSKNGM